MTKATDTAVIDPFEAALVASVVKGRSPWEDAWHRLLKNRAAVVSFGIMCCMFLLVLFGPMLISNGKFQRFIENRTFGGPVVDPQDRSTLETLDPLVLRLRPTCEVNRCNQNQSSFLTTPR